MASRATAAGQFNPLGQATAALPAAQTAASAPTTPSGAAAFGRSRRTHAGLRKLRTVGMLIRFPH